jgi:hypothetical protein
LKRVLLIILLFTCCKSWGQDAFSIASDLSVLRNLNPKQKFTAIGQTIKVNFHIGPKDAAYAWLSYYGNGNFRFNEIASAKSPFTTPQQINLSVRSTFKYNQYSLGWKRYFKGNYEQEGRVNIYGYGGFGILFGKIENKYSQPVDTSLYTTKAPLQGQGKFTRLTLDAGLGSEYAIAPFLFIYTELRTWLPASDYPSEYLRDNKSVPSVIALNIGARILF